MSIEIKNLSFSYGEHKVIDDISFKANNGEFIALLGPNGTGKSTLFKCILGINKGYDGAILIDNENAASYTPQRLAGKIAYVPQYSAPVFDYTVLDTVLMGMAAEIPKFSSPKKEHINKAMDILKSLGIEHLKNRGCGKISGGERQLTMLARALAQGARTLVLDEPCSGLDYGNQFKVMSKISRLASDGYTVIMSTHDPNQAFLYADKALALKNGKISAFGSPSTTLDENILSLLYGINVKKFDINLDNKDITICVPKGERRPAMHMWKPEMIEYMTRASLFGDYNKQLAAIISKHISNDDTLCDAGCGLGFLSRELSPYAKSVTAVDINDRALSVLKNDLQNYPNVTGENCDIFEYSKSEFDIMVFNYFGKIDEIMSIAQRLCKKRIIIVKRSTDKHGFSFDLDSISGNIRLNTDDYLDNHGIKYIKEQYSIEFGQPLKSIEDAVRFFNLYRSPDSAKMSESDIKEKIVPINKNDYNYYYPYKKEIAVYVINMKDIEGAVK